MSRLIDGDALADRLNNLAYDDWNQGVSTTWANAFAKCADMVDDAPTVDPVKHGRWILTDEPVFGNPYGSYRCSECGNGMPHKTLYCCGCGARMDEVEE